MGLVPLFNIKDIDRSFDNFYKEVDSKELEVLKYIGEAFVNEARSMHTYKDRTGNLRSSIGYQIAHKGKVVFGDFQGTPEGQQAAKEVVKDVLSKERTGFVLIGVAGMNYAYYVESKGLDVITGSTQKAEKMMETIVKKL